MFYRAGVKMREQGGQLIEMVRKEYPELDEAPSKPASEQNSVPKQPRKRDRNGRNRVETEVQNNEKENTAGGGVNRRTAVLFTRKARARASKGEQLSNSDGDQKKQADSFRVYR